MDARAPVTAAPSGGGARAGDVVSAYVGAQAGRLKALDAAVRRDEPDAVHQMRVTTRRLRAVLQAFPMVWPAATAGLRDELRWLGRVLGDARDAEVLEQHFQAALAELPVELVIGPAKARVTAHFAPEQAAARKAALKALDSRRYFGSSTTWTGYSTTRRRRRRRRPPPPRFCRRRLPAPTAGPSAGWAGPGGRRRRRP